MVIPIKAISSWVHQKYGVPDRIKDFRNVRPIIREPEMLSLNEQKKLRNHLLNCNDSISLGIILGMFTGLRIGELCAVRWSDICEENDAITISKSMQRLPVMQDSNKISKNKTQVIITTPKTNTSARTKKTIPSLFTKMKESFFKLTFIKFSNI